MVFEMHSHTAEESACSHVRAVDLVRRTFEVGLQGIVLTDHHFLWGEDALQELRDRAGVTREFLLLSGQEVTTADFSDVLVYGAERTIARGITLARLRREFPQAALVWAHPYRYRNRPERQQLLDPHLDAVEVLNANQNDLENSRGWRDWKELGFTAIGGTDIHALEDTGIFSTQFDRPVQSITALAQEIKKGNCRPLGGPHRTSLRGRVNA